MRSPSTWDTRVKVKAMVEEEEGEVEGEKREEEAMMVVTASQVVLLHLLRVVVGGRSLLLVYCDSFNIQGSCPIPVSSGNEVTE